MKKDRWNKKPHYALYGSSILVRTYCNDCKLWTIVLDKIKQCCDDVCDEEICSTERLSEPSREKTRGGPRLPIKKKVLEEQSNRCAYCDRPFISRPIWDHFIPFSYLQGSPHDNWVACCSRCNGIKSNLMFESVEAVRIYILTKKEN